MGYNWGVASSLSNLGVLAVASGQWHKARSFFERSLHLRQELGDVEGVVLVHNNLGTLDRDQGHLDRARVHFEASLATAAPLEMGFHTANSSIGLAQALLGTGQVEAARTSVIAGMRLAKRIGADEVLAEAYRVQAEIYSQTGEVELARAQAERSAALAAEIGQANLEVAAWRVAASIALQLQDYVMAQDALDRAQQAAGIGVDDIEIGRLAAVAGRLHMRTGEIALAKESLTAAREVFMRLGARIELADIEDALRASTQSRIVTTESSISAGSIQIGGCAPSPSTCLQ